MSASYAKEAVDNLGSAQLVCDKFNVNKYVIKACDQNRKIESRVSPDRAIS
jgi:hypothetical protein